jgi:hypothetical protein
VAVTQIAEILRVLDRNRVDFVVVGSAAAVLLGAGYSTEGLDIVPSLSDENLERLLAALAEIDATYLDVAGREIRPDLARLRANRLNLLKTRFGRLDVLRSIEPDRDFEQLAQRAAALEVEGLSVRTVDLETLIDAKERADRPKDRLHLIYLRETLRLSRLKSGGA